MVIETKLDLPNPRLHNADIAYVVNYGSWGVNLHHRSNWRTPCISIRVDVLGAQRNIGPLLKSRIKIILYKIYIQPMMAHDAEAWAFIYK